jgi:hypothetical protein
MIKGGKRDNIGTYTTKIHKAPNVERISVGKSK